MPPPSDVDLLLDETAEISCDATGSPPPEISWTAKGNNAAFHLVKIAQTECFINGHTTLSILSRPHKSVDREKVKWKRLQIETSSEIVKEICLL